MPEHFSVSAVVMLGVEGLRAIWRNKLRSSLTALGITVGIGAVVCVVAIGTAGSQHAEAELQKLGNNLVWVEAGSRCLCLLGERSSCLASRPWSPAGCPRGPRQSRDLQPVAVNVLRDSDGIRSFVEPVPNHEIRNPSASCPEPRHGQGTAPDVCPLDSGGHYTAIVNPYTSRARLPGRRSRWAAGVRSHTGYT
jgi:hypothetical protein